MVAPDKLIRGMVIDKELKAEIERRYNGWDDLCQQLEIERMRNVACDVLSAMGNSYSKESTQGFEDWHSSHAKYMEPADIIHWCRDAYNAGVTSKCDVQLAAAQAKIDELMLEYCPEEMTNEQIAEYEKHQRAVTEPKL